MGLFAEEMPLDQQALTEFGERLAAERERLGLSQAEFADACCVKPAHQYLFERGDRWPSKFEYLRRAQKVGMRIGVLFGETSE